jgi:alkylhydroperoxidase family enzyme
MAWITDVPESGDSPFMAAQGLNPAARAAYRSLYAALFDAPSPLSGVERRALAVVVSAINGSRY